MTFGQEKKASNYKFIIVPEQFSFLKEKDQYKTSSLTKFLLKKNGFTVILDSEEYPAELKSNPCNGLNAVVVDKSSMFKTQFVIELKDCFNKVIYTSEEGVSREKVYKKSYQEAIRNAHESMIDLQYEALTNEAVVTTKIDEVAEAPLETKNTATPIVATPFVLKDSKAPLKNAAAIKNLYAQPNENGFQLINLKPEVVFLILNTNIKNVFILKNKNGILYKKEANWVAEFYENGQLIEKIYQIKF